jgi:hypothetical protein
VYNYVRKEGRIETTPKEITSLEAKNKNSFSVQMRSKDTSAKNSLS